MSDTRAFSMELDIDASPEDVWKALTEKGELVRWFPLNAEVTPGAGGSMRWSWEESWTWDLRIDGWEPGRRLRLVQDDTPVFDAEGRRLDKQRSPGGVIALEFTLEARGGQTRLRLVHSGFGAAADWDDEYDSISVGWQSELRSLKHYLERHRGRDRQVAVVRTSTADSPSAAWRRLTGGEGFALKPAVPREGEPFEMALPGGPRYTGRVVLFIPDRAFFGVVPGLGDAQLTLHTHLAEGRTGIQAWLGCWGCPPRAAEQFRAAAEQAIDQLAGAR
jgi:uncharacterized protein YndB with AHSA1/START domain